MDRGMLGVRFVLADRRTLAVGSGQYQWAPFVGFGYDIPDLGLRVAPLLATS